MSVYVIGRIVVKDAAKWASYREQVPATLAPWGAEVLLRGRGLPLLGEAGGDVVVVRYPDAASVRGWHASAAYQALIPLREQACDMVLAAYEEA